MSDNVKLFKLISSEEVLATVLDETDSQYTIDKAIAMVYTPVEGKGMAASFTPFIPYCIGTTILNKHSVSCISQPQDKVKEEYRRAFSDIIIAPANSI